MTLMTFMIENIYASMVHVKYPESPRQMKLPVCKYTEHSQFIVLELPEPWKAS